MSYVMSMEFDPTDPPESQNAISESEDSEVNQSNENVAPFPYEEDFYFSSHESPSYDPYDDPELLSRWDWT